LELLEGRTVPSTVTTLLDNVPGSLRDAIATTPPGGTVDFQPGLSGSVILSGSSLSITKDLTVAGPGASVITIDANGTGGINTDASQVSITGLTLTHGRIDNSGSLTLSGCTISDNHVDDQGGGVRNEVGATMTLSDCTVSGNVVTYVQGLGHGGGISNWGTMTVTASTISGNTAIWGGGIFNVGTMTVTDSTIRGNSASWGVGGGINNDVNGYINNAGGILTVTDSTISGNSAGSNGGGLWNGGRVLNTIVAGNSSPNGPDVSGALTSLGYNLIGDGSGVSNLTATDLVGTDAQPLDPKLGPLQDNGGPTQTMALLPGSPAIGAGDPTNAPAYDQRGPGYPRVVNGSIDIGAFEVQTPPRVVTGTPGPDSIVFTLGETASNLTVSINGVVSSLSNATNVEIDGQGGGDSITITDTAAAAHFRVSAHDMLVNGVDIFSADTNLTWTLVGQGGGDTFALQPGASASLIARLGNNTLHGPDAASAWTITGKGTGTVGAVTFQGLATLVGGNAANTFHIEAGGVVGNLIDGGPGGDTANTLVGPDTPGTQWYITATDAGAVGPNHFTRIGNLIGGASWDVFRLSDGVGVSGKLDGGGGGNLLDYAAYTTGVVVNMTTGVATNVTGGIANIQCATGGSGDDLLVGNAQNNVLIGNGGNDTLKGGKGHDILVGGDGNDLLIAGPNRSILIGGAGSDTLTGGNGDDLLIAGPTAYDADTSALVAIRNEWIRLDESYDLRVSNLSGQTSGGVNGSYVLTSTTVPDDGVPDTLTGSGGNDWFWATVPPDTITNSNTGIVSLWPGDGNANDIVGGNIGTLQGGATFAPGLVGQAFSFNGSGANVSVPYSSSLALHAFTVQAWVDISTTAPGFPAGFGILGTRFGGDYTFDFKVEANQIHGDVGNGTNWISTSVDFPATLTPGTWHLITYVIDNGSKQFSLYLDGTLQRTIAFSGTPLFMTLSETMEIGNSYGGEYYNGLIDEVSLYNRALSPAEIRQLYNALSTGSNTGIVSSWPGEGNANDTVGGNHGTLVGGATFAPGLVGQAFSLNGTSAYVNVPDAPSLDPTAAITVAAWIDPVAHVGFADPLVKKAGEDTQQQDGYTLEFINDRVRFLVYLSGQGWVASPSASVPLGQWSYVVGTYANGSGLAFYVNGQLIGTTDVSGSMAPSGNPLEIGHDPSTTGRWYDGLIDEVSLYNRALSPAEIQRKRPVYGRLASAGTMAAFSPTRKPH
jgi:hypothetical protein